MKPYFLTTFLLILLCFEVNGQTPKLKLKGDKIIEATNLYQQKQNCTKNNSVRFGNIVKMYFDGFSVPNVIVMETHENKRYDIILDDKYITDSFNQENLERFTKTLVIGKKVKYKVYLCGPFGKFPYLDNLRSGPLKLEQDL